MTVEQLDTLKAERKEQMAALIKSKRIELEAKKLQSPLYEKRMFEEEDLNTLNAIISEIEEMYAVNKRKVSQVFGYGPVVNKLIMIAQATLYSKQEEKAELLMITGMPESLVEDIMEAYGSTAYFSAKELCIKPAKPMQIVELKKLLDLAAQDIGLVSELKLSKLNATNIDEIYARAQLRAEELLENTLEHLEESSVSYEE